MTKTDKQIIVAAILALVSIVGAAMYINLQPIKITPAPQGCVVIEQAAFYNYHCPKMIQIVDPIIDERE